MRVVIDLQGAQTGSRNRGIGRYTAALVKEMLCQGDGIEFFIILNGMFPDDIEEIRAEYGDYLDQDHILTWSGLGPVKMIDVENDQRRRFSERMREAFIANLEPDVLLVTSLVEGVGDNAVGTVKSLFDVPTICILYDLIPLIYEAIYLPVPELQRWYHAKLSELKKADLLFAISDSSAQEAVDYLGFDASSVCNISTASEGAFYKKPLTAGDRKALAKDYAIKRPYLLYVSAGDERKNHRALIDAFAKAKRELKQKHSLVLAGALLPDTVAQFHAHAEQAGLGKDDLIITGPVDDAVLLTLYNGCAAFVFPSWHEGFGLPVLEAMQCGKAVIASNASSLPEVVGRASALFDPYDAQDMARMIAKVLNDVKFRESLERHADKQVKCFSWKKSAARALEQIRAFGKRRRRLDHSEIALSRLAASLRHDPSFQDLPREDVLNAIAANFPAASRERQILVDVSELIHHDAASGIQRVVRSILTHWLAMDVPGWVIEPVYASQGEKGYRYARQFKARFTGQPEVVAPDPKVDVYAGDRFIGLDLQHYVVTDQVETYQQYRAKGVDVRFVVYDLLPLFLPQHFPDWLPAMHERWLAALTSTDGAYCISRAVADDLVHWLDTSGATRKRPFAVDWFHLGSDIEDSRPSSGLPDDASHILDQLKARPTYLSVATIEPRKGHAQTLAAFELLWKAGVDANLVFVGKKGWSVDALAEQMEGHPEQGSRFFWLNTVSDEFLGDIYTSSQCLIAASEGEGFGLPLIEAAQKGVALLARDIPVFKEVAGQGASYFQNSLKPEVIADAVRAWLIDAKAGKNPAPDEIAWLSWKQSATILLEKILLPERAYCSWNGKNEAIESAGL